MICVYFDFWEFPPSHGSLQKTTELAEGEAGASIKMYGCTGAVPVLAWLMMRSRSKLEFLGRSGGFRAHGDNPRMDGEFMTQNQTI